MSHTGAAIFKKASGMINIVEEKFPALLTWTSTDGTSTLTIELNTVDKLQATPANSDKMMLRLVGKLPENKKQKTDTDAPPQPANVKPPVTIFQFNNRIVMDGIKETLQVIIARYKDNEIYEEKMKLKENQAIQRLETPLINTSQLDDSLSFNNLLSNMELQQSLLKSNKQLFKKFQETVMNASLPPREFWSTRIPELRAFALTSSQKFGPYNVLSTIKPVASSDNKVNVRVSKKKIFTILTNYPVVRKAFDDNVPKNFSEQEFWARFFSSKLFRRLRGERIMANDRGDVILDRYLSLEQEMLQKDAMEENKHRVKRTIDLEGNEEDDPDLLGNQPDFTMRAGTDFMGNSDSTADILRRMNSLSEKMIKSLEHEYTRSTSSSKGADESDVSGDEDEEKEILIQDLEQQTKVEYAEIKIQEKRTDFERQFVENKDEKQDESVDLLLKHLNKMEKDLSKTIDLTRLCDQDGNKHNEKANLIIIDAVHVNAKQSKSFGAQEATHDSGVPMEIIEACCVLNETCCEFLKHFYNHFQSGDPRHSGITRKLHSHLEKCLLKLEIPVKENSLCEEYLKPVIKAIIRSLEKFEDVAET